MIDSHSLKTGQNFKDLPEVYVIFITLNDILRRNKTIYMIHKYTDEDLKPFDDGAHLIYINGSAKDDGSEIWKLIHDLRCTKADEMFFPRLAARVKFLKEDEKGVKIVSDYFEKLQEKAIEQEKENFVLNLINLGKLTFDEIAKFSGLTLKKVKMLANTL